MFCHGTNLGIIMTQVWHVRQKMAGRRGERTFGRVMKNVTVTCSFGISKNGDDKARKESPSGDYEESWCEK
jgi:hypothetical protein